MKDFNSANINAFLRPVIKNRIGTEVNVNGARELARKEWNKTALSAGDLAYAMLLESVFNADEHCDVALPENALDDATVQQIQSICLTANSTHANGSKAAAGAAIGLNFGWIGAAIGGIMGWAVGQNGANNDISAITAISGQACDYMCDRLCQFADTRQIKQNPVHNFKNDKKDDSNTAVSFDPNAENKLNSLIGLASIKRQISLMKASLKKAQITGNPINMNMCFYGNPGTGKTEVARLLAHIFCKEGLLTSSKCVETDRSGLVAEYIGQTAVKTHAKFEEAMGGVLFIDEAYALDGGADNDFGKEAISALLKDMEDYRGKVCVILAGYKQPMEKMFDINPGFRSRINRYIDFPNYSSDELKDILELMVKNKKYTIDYDALDLLTRVVVSRQNEANFANARDARNALEAVMEIQALRTESTPTDVRIMMKDVCDYINENGIELIY